MSWGFWNFLIGISNYAEISSANQRIGDLSADMQAQEAERDKKEARVKEVNDALFTFNTNLTAVKRSLDETDSPGEEMFGQAFLEGYQFARWCELHGVTQAYFDAPDWKKIFSDAMGTARELQRQAEKYLGEEACAALREYAHVTSNVLPALHRLRCWRAILALYPKPAAWRGRSVLLGGFVIFILIAVFGPGLFWPNFWSDYPAKERVVAGVVLLIFFPLSFLFSFVTVHPVISAICHEYDERARGRAMPEMLKIARAAGAQFSDAVSRWEVEQKHEESLAAFQKYDSEVASGASTERLDAKLQRFLSWVQEIEDYYQLPPYCGPSES